MLSAIWEEAGHGNRIMIAANGRAELIMLLRTVRHSHLHLWTELLSHFFIITPQPVNERLKMLPRGTNPRADWAVRLNTLKPFTEPALVRKCKLCCHMFSPAGMTRMHFQTGRMLHIYSGVHVCSDTSVEHKSWLMCAEFERRGLSLWYLCICVSITRPPPQHYLYTVLQT